MSVQERRFAYTGAGAVLGAALGTYFGSAKSRPWGIVAGTAGAGAGSFIGAIVAAKVVSVPPGELEGLGVLTPESPGVTTLTPEQEKAIFEFVQGELELVEKQEAIKERKSRRFWGGVASLAAATTALVGVLTFAASRR